MIDDSILDSVSNMEIYQSSEENHKVDRKLLVKTKWKKFSKHSGPKLSDLNIGTLSGPIFLCSWRDLWLLTRVKNHFVKLKFLDAVMRVLCYAFNSRKVMSILTKVTRCWKPGKSKEVAAAGR